MAMEFGKLNFAVGFNRTSAFPLDANSYFESYDDAVQAASGAAEVGSSDSAYYIGQLLIVKDSEVGVGLYQINAGKTLTKFGQASSADELASKVSALESRCTTIEGKLILATTEKDGLMSKEDFAKLTGIEAGAQANKIEKVSVDGTEIAPTNKAVNIAIAGKYDATGSLVKSETGVAISGTISPITVIDKAGTLPSFTEGSFTANTPTAIDTTKFNAGSVKFPTLTAASIATKPTSKFATNGIVASVDENETLVFGSAETADAVTDVTIDGGKLAGGSYTAPSLEDGFYTAGSAASYTEGTFSAGSLPTIKEVTPTFTGDKFGFKGDAIKAHTEAAGD